MWIDILKDWAFKKEDFKIGIISGIFIIIALLLLISGGTLNIKSTPKEVYILAPDTIPVLGFPSYKEPTEFSLYIYNISGECVYTGIKFNSGIHREGIYCENDKMYVLNYVITIDKILKTDDVKKPITISYYKISNIANLMVILLIVLPLFAIIYKINNIAQKREDRLKSKKRLTLAKKLHIKPETLDELMTELKDDE